MSALAVEIQSLSPTAIIELFEIDTSGLPGGGIFRFHAGTNQLQQPVVWQGLTYTPLPIEAEGFEVTSQGTLPRPKIRVANVQGLFSAIASENEDLVGCKVTRRRTFVRFLDAVNFPSGNPEADPYQHLNDDVYFVEQKTSETRYVIEWELTSAFDLFGVTLPRRQVIQSTCMWRYRSAECGYTGIDYFDSNDNPTTLANDMCGKRLSSCKCRFPGVSLPYGGFPGALRGN